MHGLPRRRIHHLTATAILSTVVSLFPFLTICIHREAFQPPSLRAAMLLCFTLSWAFNLCSSAMSTLAWHLHKAAHPLRNQIQRGDDHPLNLLLIAVSFGSVGCCFVLAAQAIWTYIASQVGIVWILCLSVLGLALFMVLTASILLLLGRIWKIRRYDGVQDICLQDGCNDKSGHSEGIQLEIDKDAYSPQRIVATIPAHDSELVF